MQQAASYKMTSLELSLFVSDKFKGPVPERHDGKNVFYKMATPPTSWLMGKIKSLKDGVCMVALVMSITTIW